MKSWWMVAVGGASGSLLRYLISGLFSTLSDRIPCGTLIVNVTGSFMIGLLTASGILGRPIDPRLRLLFITGFLGAFTTFSTLSHETFQLIADGRPVAAGINAGFNLLLGLGAVWAGIYAGRFF